MKDVGAVFFLMGLAVGLVFGAVATGALMEERVNPAMPKVYQETLTACEGNLLGASRAWNTCEKAYGEVVVQALGCQKQVIECESAGYIK